MSIVAIAGDVSTTTAVALASAWPVGEDILVVEADPTGGDLAAWFDMPVAPSLSTVVTSTRVLSGPRPRTSTQMGVQKPALNSPRKPTRQSPICGPAASEVADRAVFGATAPTANNAAIVATRNDVARGFMVCRKGLGFARVVARAD